MMWSANDFLHPITGEPRPASETSRLQHRTRSALDVHSSHQAAFCSLLLFWQTLLRKNMSQSTAHPFQEVDPFSGQQCLILPTKIDLIVFQ